MPCVPWTKGLERCIFKTHNALTCMDGKHKHTVYPFLHFVTFNKVDLGNKVSDRDFVSCSFIVVLLHFLQVEAPVKQTELLIHRAQCEPSTTVY